MSLAVIALAAGKSTRFKSKTSKVLHLVGERPMLGYTLDLAAELALKPPVLVVGPETEEEIRTWAGERARYVRQTERLGTGHAVLQTREMIEGHCDQVLVLYGDMPLLQLDTLRALVRRQAETKAAVGLLTVIRENPRGFGRILREADNRVLSIVEEAEASPREREIRELNVGVYVFDADFLWEHLPKLKPSANKGELYLTDLIGMASRARRPIVSVTVDDPAETLGINTRVDLAAAETVLRQRINREWMLSGVTLMDPATITIGPEVTIGRDTVIHANTHLRGATTIGEDCEIGPNTIIEHCTLGQRCRVLASVLEHAVMEDDTDIGPFGHLRKGARMCEGAHMGNFGEMKNSTLGPGAKMGHFSYLGDAEVGEAVNIGAGTITCNYDGERKHRTEIEKGAFIGSDTMLVAPVHIGAGAKIGAGSVVTHDLPPQAIAYGVPARIRKTNQPEEEAPSIAASDDA